MLNYSFSNILGCVHNTGEILFIKNSENSLNNNNNILLSPVNNKLLIFNFDTNISTCLPFETIFPINNIEISPNGKILILIDLSGYTLIINFIKKIIIGHFNFHCRVNKIKISNDNNFLVVSIKNNIKIFQLPLLKKQIEPLILIKNYNNFHEDVITSLNWSNDSKFILSGSKDNSVRLLNVFKIKNYVPFKFIGHKKKIIKCFFSEDNLRIFSISQDGIILIWKYEEDVSEEYLKRKKFEKYKNFKNLKGKFENDDENETDDENNENEDEKYLTEFEKKISNGRFILEKKQQFNTNSKVCQCEISTNNNNSILILGFIDGSFSIFSLTNFQNIYSLKITSSKITSISINSAQNSIAFGSKYSYQLIVYNYKSENFIFNQTGFFSYIENISFSPDGNFIAANSKNILKIFEISRNVCLKTFSENNNNITDITFSNNSNNLLITSSLDGTVRAYDLKKYINFRIMTSPKLTQFLSVSIDNSGEIIASSSNDFNIYVWNLKTGDLIDILSSHTDNVNIIRFNYNKINNNNNNFIENECFLVSGSWDNSIKIWSLFSKKKLIESLDNNSKVICLCIRPDGKEISVSTLKGEIFVWDFDDGYVKNIIDVSKEIWVGRKINEKKIRNNNKFFNSINYNLSGNLLICGGNSNYVCIYDMNYYILIKKICITYNQNLDGILYKLNSKFDNNNNNNNINFNDSEDEIEMKNKMKKILPGNNNNINNEIKINSVQFSNTNREFAVGCTEGIFIYSLDKKENYFNLNLDVNVTIKDCVNLFYEKKYLKAIIYSIYLNKLNIFEKFLLSIDVNFIESIVKKFPVNIIESLINFFCAKIENNNNNINKNIELLFKWIFFIVKFHGEKIKEKKEIFLNIQKCFNKIFNGIENVVKDNIYTTKFLIEYENNDENNNENN